MPQSLSSMNGNTPKGKEFQVVNHVAGYDFLDGNSSMNDVFTENAMMFGSQNELIEANSLSQVHVNDINSQIDQNNHKVHVS